MLKVDRRLVDPYHNKKKLIGGRSDAYCKGICISKSIMFSKQTERPISFFDLPKACQS